MMAVPVAPTVRPSAALLRACELAWWPAYNQAAKVVFSIRSKLARDLQAAGNPNSKKWQDPAARAGLARLDAVIGRWEKVFEERLCGGTLFVGDDTMATGLVSAHYGRNKSPCWNPSATHWKGFEVDLAKRAKKVIGWTTCGDLPGYYAEILEAWKKSRKAGGCSRRVEKQLGDLSLSLQNLIGTERQIALAMTGNYPDIQQIGEYGAAVNDLSKVACERALDFLSVAAAMRKARADRQKRSARKKR